jgi:hypothetical protein
MVKGYIDLSLQLWLAGLCLVMAGLIIVLGMGAALKVVEYYRNKRSRNDNDSSID